jgi:hypothetical protein
MPENSVYVGRPSRWGNPFRVTTLKKKYKNVRRPWDIVDDRDKALTEFREYAEHRYLNNPEWIDPLIDKDLVCWCPLTKPCHADFLLELARHRKAELSK